jgi:hypothetical protein
MLQHIQHNLARAQQRMKSQANKNRQERTFALGLYKVTASHSTIFQPQIKSQAQFLSTLGHI